MVCRGTKAVFFSLIPDTQKLKSLISACLVFFFCIETASAQSHTIRGKIVDENGKALSFATIRVIQTEMSSQSQFDGTFEFDIPVFLNELTLTISHVGKETVTKSLNKSQFTQFQRISLRPLNLELNNVEVNGVRKSTTVSNSSIVFDREAIEQAQALSVVNVLSYLPGKTIIKPNVSIQGVQPLILRAAIQPGDLEQELNNAFGVSIQLDGSTISNDANMQATNPGFMQLGGANDIQHPENSFIRDRSQRNGTLYRSYGSITANNGVDLRQIPAENIENIEVVSGVASARYGDYTSGVVIINRQAGVTPWRVSIRTNEGTQNVGINKGFRINPTLGTVSVNFDYLNSNDDPRNKLKAFQRVGGGFIWTFQRKEARFKNNLSVDYGSTIDQTRRDPDEGRQRMAKFNNTNFRVSNRSEWLIRKPWLYNIQLQGSYSRRREESYDQYYLNTNPVIPVVSSTESGIYEAEFAPGYYLAMHHIIGIPVTASARLETSSIFRFNKTNVYKLSLGINYSYAGNKGPGVLIDPKRPRFDNMGFKNDRPRVFDQVPDQHNTGIYMENNLTTRLLNKPFNANVGVRGDIQNGFFSVSPRVNANWKLSRQLSWKIAYGIATKAPSLSQISPGDIFFDIPLINSYSSDPLKQLYLVQTEVLKTSNLNIRPYRSITAETGLSWDNRLFRTSLFVFHRVSKDGFAQVNTLYPLTVAKYDTTSQPGQPLQYFPTGADTVYNLTYSRLANGTYSRTNGLEIMINTNKIRAIQTSFAFTTAYYNTYSLNNTDDLLLPERPDFTKEALFGVFKNQERKTRNIKSTVVSTTHIPSLRMAVMLTGELFWVSRSVSLPSAIYPSGYYTKEGVYFPLTKEEAMSDDYAHLRRVATNEAVTYSPAFFYPNIHLRLSKEIGNVLRFSFNAYNVFNIRPVEKKPSGYAYYNGQPSFGAEMTFTLK